MVLDAADSRACGSIADKLSIIMENILKRLSRLDQGKITAMVLTVVSNNEDVSDKFIEFILSNLGILRQFLKQKRLLDLVTKYIWDKHCQLWCDWLVARQEVELHMKQFNALSSIIESCRGLFEEQGLSDTALETEQFKAAYSKLQIEKALLNLNEPSMLARNVELEESYRSNVNQHEEDRYL